jgi:hypothetical protein
MSYQRDKMIFIYLSLIVIVASTFYFWYRWRNSNYNLSNNDAVEEMKVRASQAIEIASSEYETSLDYSPESVAKVEEILGKIHERNIKEPISEKQLVKESLRWGGYIGEVIIRIKPCHWELNSKIGGEGSLPIVFENEKHETFPVGWCYKRIINGPEDNVWHKFNFLVVEDANRSVNKKSENTRN